METPAPLVSSGSSPTELPSLVAFIIGAVILTVCIVAPLVVMAAKSKNIFKRHLQLPLR